MTGMMDSSTFYSCDAPKGSTPGSIETPQLYKEKGNKGEFCETSKIRKFTQTLVRMAGGHRR
jgi:hypothetical protein